MQHCYKSAVFLSVLVYFCSSFVYARPICASADSDPDGDGFGWEAGESCLVESTATGASTSSSTSTSSVSSPGRSRVVRVCQNSSSDPDGDGFGWENNDSCRVLAASTSISVMRPSSSRPVCRSASADPDGDGFGWENNASCVVSRNSSASTSVFPSSTALLPEEKFTLRVPACSDQRFDPDGDDFGWENSRSCTFKNAGDGGRSITDVILVTGQSNALGAETVPFDPFDPDLDSPVRRVYAYSENGWGIAGLQQIWDQGWYPRGDIASEPANNFAFHFGKSLVRKNANAVVGIIMVTAPGAGIQFWDPDGDFFDQINSRVTDALNALPRNVKVNGILWHQGETDFYSTNFYRDRLQNLISNFRAQSWLDRDAVFVCGETLNSPVNANLRALNTDGDAKTGCVSANGLQSIGDDVHFDAASLRTLGSRYSDKYQSLKSM